MLTGKIFITGGAGYLGRSIIRRIQRDGWPASVTIYSRDETKQDLVHRRWPDVRCILGDVRDIDRLTAAAAGHDLIIDAAAIKYIPEAEHNVLECIAVNVDGSRNVALAAVRAGVPTVVGLSTDKAAASLNTYGATKLLKERIFAEVASHSDTRLVCVRYGNVVSSTGSVIPLFRHQLETYGEIRVTDLRMTRFWLSMDEAIDLITLAARNARENPGAVFVPRCGAMRVVDMARMVANGAPIREVGLRPGEKLHESLVLEAESSRTWTGLELPGLLVRLSSTPAPARYDGQFYRIAPPTTEPFNDRPFSYSSDDPGFWIKPEQMEAMIADAANI